MLVDPLSVGHYRCVLTGAAEETDLSDDFISKQMRVKERCYHSEEKAESEYDISGCDNIRHKADEIVRDVLCPKYWDALVNNQDRPVQAGIHLLREKKVGIPDSGTFACSYSRYRYTLK